MSVRDVIKNSFLAGYTTGEIGTKMILVVFAISAIIGLYIFFCYRAMTRRTFYSKSFATSLIAVDIIVAAIVLSMQSNIIVSLGMVGALSIVRFRTAVKDPLDLVFLFWSIATGIICGVGLSEVALLLALVLTCILIFADKIPANRAPMILVLNSRNDSNAERRLEEKIRLYTRYYSVKSKNYTKETIEWAIELKFARGGMRLLRMS